MKSVLKVLVTVVMVTSIIGLPLKALAAESSLPLPELVENEVEQVGGREGIKSWLGCMRLDFGMDRPLTEFVEALVGEYNTVDESYFWDFLSEMYWDEVPEEKRVYPKNPNLENERPNPIIVDAEINEAPLEPEIGEAPIDLEADDADDYIIDDESEEYLVIEVEDVVVYVEVTALYPDKIEVEHDPNVFSDVSDTTGNASADLDTGKISAEVYTTNGADSTSIVNDGAEGLTLVSDVNQAR